MLKYQIKLNPRTGILTVKFENVSLITGLGANFQASGATLTQRQQSRPGRPRQGSPGRGGPALQTSTTTTTTTTTPVTPTPTVSYDQTDVVKFLYRRHGAVAKGTARRNTRLAPAGLFLVTRCGQRTASGSQPRPLVPARDRVPAPGGGTSIEIDPAAPVPDSKVNLLFGSLTSALSPPPASNRTAKGGWCSSTRAAAPLFNFIIDNKKGTFYFDTHGLDPYPAVWR